MDLIYRRPWLTVFAINAVALALVGAVTAWWTGEVPLATKVFLIAPVAALLFTLKQTWWWNGKNPSDAIWRKRFVQMTAIWGAVFVILAFILFGVH
jgi:hypothetical protein